MDNLKIALIDSNTSWMSKSSDIHDQVVLPIGLMYLSSFLKKKFVKQLEILVINTAIDVDNIDDLYKQLNIFKPNVVGFRVLTTNKFFFEEIVGKIKKQHQDAHIIVGGPHVACQPNEVLRLKEVNAIVIGEGELTFAELIECILLGKDYYNIKGIGYMLNGKIIINTSRDPIKNLDDLPNPDYTSVDIEKYSKVLNYGYTIRKQGVILTSRGCPFFCSYCFKFLGQVYRKRSAKNIYFELESLVQNYGIKDFFIVDDSFNIDRQRCVELFSLIIKNNLDIRLYFTSGLRGDLLDKELIDLMVEAGTIWITFAVETVNKRLQRLINRVYNIDKMRENIVYAESKKIMVGLFFMIGFPTEVKTEAMETINFIKELDCVTMPFIFGVKYFPGTKLTQYALENFYIKPEAIDSIYKYYHNFDSLATSTMTNVDFKGIFYIYLREIFLNKKRLTNALELQKKYLSNKEMAMLYSSFFNKKIEDPFLFFKKYLSNI